MGCPGHRRGREPGANIATAHADLVNRIIAGWPAAALLIAVKLLSGMLEHQDSPDAPTLPVPRPARAHTGPQDTASRRGGLRSLRRAGSPARRPAQTRPATDGSRPTRPAVLPDPSPGIALLEPAARAVRDELERDGCALTRDALAVGLRRQGCPIGNARVTLLLRALRDQVRDARGRASEAVAEA